MMLSQRNPNAAYRRVDFDARVSSASPQDLVKLCYEQLIGALGRAQLAHERRDNRMKSDALTRASSALIALQMGVSGDGEMAGALNQLYTSARQTVLDNVVQFSPETIATIRADFVEISAAMNG